MPRDEDDPLNALRSPEAYADWCEIAVRFSDQDLNHHVNNTAIAQYVEEARVSLRHRQFSEDVLRVPVAYAIVSFRIRYLKPIHYPGSVRVGTSVVRLGRTSYTLVHAVLSGGAVAALARSVIVTLDPAREGPKPIPEPIRQAMTALLRDRPAIIAACDQI